MSVRTQESGPETGPLPAIPASETGAGDTVGLLYARLTALPALLVIPFLLTSFPLLLLGWFKPVPVILAWLAVAALLVPFGWRRIPSVAGALGWGAAPGAAGKRTPWWALAALAVVAVGFGADQAIFRSSFIIVMLDAASYMQYGFWISHHGAVPIAQHAAAFGGAPGISFNSAAFYQVGQAIMPQFMSGLPMVLSLGYWAGGVKAALLIGPLLGAAAVFTFGGLAARLVGPRWGWVAALVIAVSQPEEFTSRATYSEPLSQILLLGGLALWIDTQRTDRAGRADGGGWLRGWGARRRRATHVLAFLAGLALGINLLVRIDAPSDILLAVPYCGVLVLQRRRQVVPLVAGLVVGLAYGTVDGLVLSRPYVRTNISSVAPMTAAFALAGVVTALVVVVLLRRGKVPRVHPRLADAVTVLPFLVMIAFVARPHVEKDWAALQYAPLSLHWVYWYVGGPILALAVIAAAVLARRCLRGQAPAWTLPLLVFVWTIPEFLYRPAIIPHNPYAGRRLVPAILPGLILLALWLSVWAIRTVRAAHFNVPPFLRRVPLVGVSLACAAALFVPPFQETFGLGIDSSAGGVQVVSNGTAFKRTYSGEITAVNELCRAIPANSSVLFVDYELEREMLQVVRAMCGVPAAWAVNQAPATLAADIRAIEGAHRHPVVLSATHKELAPLSGGTTKRVMALYTAIDVRDIATPPQNVDPVLMVVYRWEPGS